VDDIPRAKKMKKELNFMTEEKGAHGTSKGCGKEMIRVED